MTREDKITHIVMNSQILNNRLHDASVNGIFKQKLKQKNKTLLDELVTVEHDWFNKFFTKEEDGTCEVYKIYESFMKKIAEVPIYEMQNIMFIIEAFEKDKKSIEGICKKILRN